MDTGRRKSCEACVRAKRRCELGRPKCRRCLDKRIECNYPVSTPSGTGPNRFGTNGRQDAAIVALADSIADGQPVDPFAVAATLSPSMNGAWFEFYNEPFNLPTLPDDALMSVNSMGNIVSQQSPDGIQQIDRSSDVQIRSEFVSKRLAQIPKTFVEQAQTSFIHRGLLQLNSQPVLQDALSAAALYVFRNENNRLPAIRNLEQKAQYLIATTNPQAANRSSLLAATQALLVYQLIRLFDGDIRLRAQAEADQTFLTSWAIQLRSSMQQVSPGNGIPASEASLSPTASKDVDWQSWLLEESLRRTVIMALMLNGIYGFLKTGRDTEQDLRLSFSAHSSLWNAQSQRGWATMRKQKAGLQVRVTNWTEDIGKAAPEDLEDLGVQLMTMLWGVDVTVQWLGRDDLLHRHGFEGV